MAKFTWDKWDYDCDGEAYIIRKDLCQNREDVPGFILREDNLHDDCARPPEPYLSVNDVKDGWCKYQVRTDWENGDGEPMGGYCVWEGNGDHLNIYGKTKPGWFPVWIVRIGEWY